MSEFNFDAFRPVIVPVADTEAKRASVEAASAAKKSILAARKESWVDQIGIADGFLANRVNDVASLASGASRMVGDIATLPLNVGAALKTVGATEDEYAAYNRVQQGSTDPNDLKAAKQFQNADQVRGMAKSVRDTFDLSSIVDQSNRESLSADLGDDFEANWGKVTAGWKDGKPGDMASGIAGLLLNAGEAVVTNPSAAREYIIENAPQLFTGMLGVAGKTAMAASNIGYAADTYRKGLEEYAAKNGGALPPEEERTKRAIYAATLAGAEQAGDMLGLGMAKLGAKAAGDVAKTGALQSLKNALKAGGTAGSGEALTEGYQTFAEGEVKGTPATAKEVYEGAVIGAVAGAGLSGGARAVAEVMNVTPEQAKEREAEQTKEVTFDKAVADKKPDLFLDESSPDYNPAKAVAVIHEIAKQEPEQVADRLKEATAIIDSLEKQKAQFEKVNSAATPEVIAELTATVSLFEELIKELPQDDPELPEIKAELANTVGELKALTDEGTILRRNNKLTAVTRQLDEARESHTALHRMANPLPSKDEVSAAVEQANSSDVEVSKKAGQVLLNLSMAAPDDLDPSIIKNLVSNKKNGLTTEQRDLLRKFSEARTAELAVKKQSTVSQEILFGQKKKNGNIGIAQYRTRIAAAIESDNVEVAKRDLGMLRTFALNHRDKLNAIANANIGDQIINKEGKWVVNTGKRLSDAERVENGAVNVHQNSTTLIGEIQNEVKALRAAYIQLASAAALKFGKAAVQSVPSPAATSVSPNKSMKKSVEGETRPSVPDGPTVAGKTQKKTLEEKKAAAKAAIQKKRQPTAASPQSTPASPVAATAAPATASQSAPAEQSPAKPEAAQQPAAVSEANPAPVAEAATAEDEQDTLADKGTLSVMAFRIKDAGVKMQDLFTNELFNPIAQFFNQKAKVEATGGHRPLIAAKDFLSSWLVKKTLTPVDFVGFPVEEHHKKALAHFARHARQWNEVLKSNIGEFSDAPDQRPFKLADMMQYFKTKNGDEVVIDENVFTAMSFGMYHALVNEANNSGKTPEQLKRMHGREREAEMSNMIYRHLDGVVNIEDTMANDMGGMAMQALGLTPTKDAPPDVVSRLRTAMGMHMLTALASKEIGLLERRPVNTGLINSFFEDNGQNFSDAKNTMYVFADRAQLVEFKEVNKGTNQVVDQLFGSEKTPRIARTKPSKFRQKTAAGTNQGIPPKLAKVIGRAQKVPHKVIPDMWNLMGAIGKNNVLKVAGFRDVETGFVHEVNKKGVEAKNRGLESQLDLALEMLGVDLGATDKDFDMDTEFFVEYEVWKNFRVGVVTESLNQQASKIHRYMFARPSWTSKINLNDDTHRMALEVAIAAAIGIKTDNQPNEDTVVALKEKWLKDEKLRAAVEAVHNGLVAGQWTNTDVIADYAAGKEGMMTLQALIAYAKMMYAPADGIIEVTMLVGADGKTNGPILTQFALGAAKDSDTLMGRLNRGGIYAVGDQFPKHYSQWRKDNKGKDLYQDLASYLMDVTQDYKVADDQLEDARNAFYANPKNKNREFPGYTQKMFDAMQAIIGTLQDADMEVTKEGRDLVKTPLTAFAFGSSLRGSIHAMENKFIESIYKQMEKLAKGDVEASNAKEVQANRAKTEAFVAALNTLMQSQMPNMDGLDTSIRAAAMMNDGLHKDAEQALRAAFRNIMATPVQQSMESYFATFIQRRGDLNRTIQAGFSLYSTAYHTIRAKAINEMVNGEEGTVAWREKTGGKEAQRRKEAGEALERVALHELNDEQEAAIRAKVDAMLPVTHTAFSMNGDLANGIYMAKQETRLSNMPSYMSTVNFARPQLTGQETPANKAGGGAGQFESKFALKAKGLLTQEIDPGVAGTPYLIHSLDSYLMHTAMADLQEALNVHDEIGHGVLEVSKAAGAINRATIQALLEFSPAREALGMLERTAIGMEKVIRDGDIDPFDISMMMEEWAEIYRRYRGYSKTRMEDVTGEEIVNGIRAMAVNNAVQADRVRLSTVAKSGAVDQYTWEGGHYEIPQGIRDKAKAMIKEIPTEMSEAGNKAFDALAAYVAGKPLPGTGAVMEPTDEAPTATPTAPAGTGFTPWGELGAPVSVDLAINEAFAKRPVMNRDQVVELLRGHTTGAARAVLEQAARVLPANLKVKLITPETETTAVIQMPKTASRGWYVPTKDGQNEIYVLSGSFRHAGVNAETLVHELVHAALAREVHEPSDRSSASMVKDLTTLLEHVRLQPGAEKFSEATKDVHEFLAWGLSNREFQAFLNSIDGVSTKTSRNRFVKAMKEFISTISKLLFRDVNAAKERALYVVIQNAAGLFAAASQGRASTLEDVMSHAAPDAYSTEQVYTELGQGAVNPLSEQDDARLRGLLNSVVDAMAPVYGVLGKQAMTSTLSAKSIWANAVTGGQAPFALDALGAGFAANDQVAFMLEQVEAIMRAAFSGSDGRTSVAYTETVKLYEEARKELNGKIDPLLYNFVFSIDNKADGSSDYLSRFASMALVHPDVNKALAFDTDRGTKKEKAETFLGRLQDMFEKVMAWVTGRWTRTYAGQQANQKLDALATQLVMIEAKRRARLNVEGSKTLQSIEDAFRNVAEKARDKVDDFATSDFFKGSKNGFVRLAGSMTSTVVKDRLDFMMQAYEDFSNQHFHHSQGMFAGLVTEMRGSNKGNVIFYKLLRMAKFLEGKRKDLITGTAKVVLQSFANKGKDLTDAQKESISNVFLRTDMAALLDRFDMKGIRELVADPAALAKAIADVTAEMGKPRHQMFYINAAKALGYQMATGEARTANNLQNAHNIARLYGTKRTAEVQQNTIDKMEPLIDVMASLYALYYTKQEHKADAVKVLDIEMAREGKDKGNGVEMVLRLHKQLQKESKDRLFKDQEALIMKGYTPEIYNPYIEVQLAIPDEVGTLKEQGFGQPIPLPLADADPERETKVLMARHGTGLQAHTTGTMSLTSMSTKGTTKHNGVLDLFSDQGQYNQGMMLKIARDAADDIEAMFRMPMEPAAEKRTFLVPVLNPNGKTVNYRYMMNNRTKKEVLQRDSRFDKLLGTMAGSIFDKQSTPKQNETVVKALHEQYKLEGAKRPKSFIEVSPRSPDPEMREIYRLLPEATKQAIREIWKTDGMMVRIDLLDMNFGYRKLSMSDVLKKDREARIGMDKFFGEVLGFVFSGGKILGGGAEDKDVKARDALATVRIRQFEEGWQTVVREIKDTLVVKSVSTFIGNMSSNFTLLYAYGVPVTDIVRHHRIAFRGAVAYKRDSDELFALQTKLDTGLSGNVAEDTKRVAQLKDALAKNPVRELIEAGLMPTIVEDVELDDDIYSFKSRMMTKLEDKTKWINKDVKNVGKQLYMAHDTTVYKALSQAAQLSDFLGRYTLYQHMTTRKRDPMPKEEAIQLASDAFINYDVPTHRKMQYMNETGFFRFTKYYLRIQKVIMHLYRDNPGRMMGLMGMEWYFDSVASVLDSSMMTRFNNPLEAGALDFPKAFTELGTVKALAIPFR